ncbi:hypothetical protein H8356DRAFT_1382510 [Neocallimastix lanati (nom. inval.)]|nr:hypothetical protein H8356DRAFT_1382510 [Neocallimastix sp. JGI-2020a]
MNGNLPKTTEQLVQMVNSSNERNNPHFDYYKKKYLNLVMMKYPLIRCLLLLILKEFNLCQKNKSMFRFIVKCNNYKLNQSDNTSNNAIIGPVNTNSPFDPSYIYTLYWLIIRIQMLIRDYIKREERSSLISNLLFKNNFTYNSNWTYTGIINNIKEVEYINFRYFKDSNSKNTNQKDSKLDTHIYNENKRFIELEELISRDTFFNKRTVNGIPLVNFTCKAYFVDILFIKNSVSCSARRNQS